MNARRRTTHGSYTKDSRGQFCPWLGRLSHLRHQRGWLARS